MDESRKAFEQSLMDEFGYPKERLEYWRGEGGYSQNQFISSRWKAWSTAWQESRAAIEIELPEKIERKVRDTDMDDERRWGHNDAIRDCAEAIRTAGIKVKE